MDRELTENICKQCDKIFYTYRKSKLGLCEDCKRQRTNEQKRSPQKHKSPLVKKSVCQVIKEMEQYNKQHGTKLTYGKYVEMMGG